MLKLILVYCPFPNSVANRKLFILFCREHYKESELGWSIIRQVEQPLEKKMKELATTDWNDDDDEWGDDSEWGDTDTNVRK